MAAARLGLSFSEYMAFHFQGLKYCWKCRQWKAKKDGHFQIDRSRPDGFAATCQTCKVTYQRSRYTPTPRKPHGWLVAARDGDKKQARRRVNYLVEQKRIPHPNALPCADCGHVWKHGERRHEYDHYRGYGAEEQLSVEAVCSTCHHAREGLRYEQAA